MESNLTFNRLKIILSKVDLERKKKLAKQMVQENEYLFVLDNNIIFKMIDKLNDTELMFLFEEFDNIGILDEYVINIINNNVNIVERKDRIFNDRNEENITTDDSKEIFIRIVSILIPILLILMYMIFIFHNK